MTLIDVNPRLAQMYDLHRQTTGVLVLDPGSQGDRIGLHVAEGSLIYAVGGEFISNLHGFAWQLLQANRLAANEDRFNGGTHAGEIIMAYDKHKSECDCYNFEWIKLTTDDIAELENYLQKSGEKNTNSH